MEYEGTMVIVSDLAEMESLRKVLENEPITLTWETKWDFAEGIARGLDSLHKSNVIHRDLKSHNILVTKNTEI
jgi:serine/threonine protein kinase